jgi:hypothetical protein
MTVNQNITGLEPGLRTLNIGTTYMIKAISHLKKLNSQ